MKSLTIVTRDNSSILTTDDAKKWLRVEGTDEDTVIAAIMAGAISYAEDFLNRTIGVNTYELTMDEFEDVVQLHKPPVAVVTEIAYVDVDGADQTFDIAKTKLDMSSGRLGLKQEESWPEVADEPFAIKISYSSNGILAGKEADAVLDAIKMTLAYRYDYRDDPNQRWKKATDNILSPLRIIPFG